MPHHKPLTLALAAMLMLTACSIIPMPTPAPTTAPDGTEAPTETEEPVNLTTPEGAAQAYLDLWQAKDYAALWQLISTDSKGKYLQEDFELLYQDAMGKMTAQTIEFDVDMADLQTTPQTARIRFNVTYGTINLGQIEKELALTLINENGTWTVMWDPAMILPELVGGNFLELQVAEADRANIYDRNGLWLVQSESPVATISVIPSLVGDAEEELELLEELSSIMRLPNGIIQNQYSGGGDQPIAVGDVDVEVLNDLYPHLYNYEAVVINENKTGRRTYYNLAPQVLGYISLLQPDQVAEYVAQGYARDALIGQAGLEKTQESILAGQSGGTLTAFTPTGQVYAVIASRESQPAQNVYTTLDRDLQIIVQDALAEAYYVSQQTWQPNALGAAAIVVDVNTGDVLAMASYPQFDPNVLNPQNANPLLSNNYINAINADPRLPQVNHATQSPQPPGSVFKMVTMAATLGEEVYPTDEVYNCQYEWNEARLGVRYDWNEEGTGPISLLQALTSSCNPWFYRMGWKLDEISHDLLPQYARDFGLGEKTGIEIDEQAGRVPDPEWLASLPAPDGREWTTDDTLNMSVGQGDLLVTPIQMVMITAAIANGGTLYQPHLVKAYGDSLEEPTHTVEPQARGTIPVSPENLALIQEAMRNVIIDREIGTAQNRVGGMAITSAGKTGTAQVSSSAQPIAWFTGYAPYEDPEIAVIVIVQNGGQGSTIASPIFRRIVERWYRLPVFHWPDDWLDPELYEEVKDIGE